MKAFKKKKMYVFALRYEFKNVVKTHLQVSI